MPAPQRPCFTRLRCYAQSLSQSEKKQVSGENVSDFHFNRYTVYKKELLSHNFLTSIHRAMVQHLDPMEQANRTLELVTFNFKLTIFWSNIFPSLPAHGPRGLQSRFQFGFMRGRLLLTYCTPV